VTFYFELEGTHSQHSIAIWAYLKHEF